jgi:hypothetical protein
VLTSKMEDKGEGIIEEIIKFRGIIEETKKT